ncbi:cellulase family glycosylhydrolase [Patulibacter sp. SYSU D01012]|uniref:cellulase family glycosylhydrolase n=1 Tax=Patulibacter sp. SYSU D01012 TaxID=2817381 RepID=UPI001B30E915|nr:cellulase family glycosylhydrolase [Patulibacter sp. SYSU D01012]
MTRNRATLALATAAASAAVLVPAGAATAAPVKGLQDQEMTVNKPELTQPFLTALGDAKVGMVRFNTSWDGKNKAPDAGQVQVVRTSAAAAVQAGAKQILVSPNITGSTSFNPRGKKKGPTAASKVSSSAYTSYIRNLATALKGIPGAELYYAPINEPNWYRHLPKRGGAALYRKLHNIAYDEIKEIDPSAKVLFGELLPYDRALSRNYPNGQSTDAGKFVREVLGLKSNWKATGKSSSYKIKADGVSLHTYDFKANPTKKRKDRDDWTQANLGYAKSDLKKAARTKRISSSAVSRIYLTEFAYKTRGKDKIPTGTAAKYLKSAWSIAKKQKVKSFVWYQLRDPQSSGEQWQSGLQTKSGSSRSTWTAFKGLK